MATNAQKQYVVDDEEKAVAVILELGEYQKLVDAMEELESLRAYDAAKASSDESIPFDQAVEEIDQRRE